MDGTDQDRNGQMALTEANATEVAKVFGDFLNRAGYGNERIVIVRRGKQVAALVGMSDFRKLPARTPDAA